MTKIEQARLLAWRLKIFRDAQGTRRVSDTCRRFGISRKTFYKWNKRYEVDGPTGLCDRHRRPHRSPRAFSHDIISKVLYLRQHYHFGPRLDQFTAIDDCTRLRVLKVYDACNQGTAIRPRPWTIVTFTSVH